jgi:hypothetical protein
MSAAANIIAIGVIVSLLWTRWEIYVAVRACELMGGNGL